MDSVSLQYQREVRSTYIVQFQDNVASSEIQGRANAIAARFNGRIRHTYTRALSGFAIRMNSVAMARLLDAGDLGIARISRGVIMTIAQSNENAAPQGRGDNPGGGGGGGGGGGPKNNETTCDQSIGWNITRVTSMVQNDSDCIVTAENGHGHSDYSATYLFTNRLRAAPIVCVLDTGVSLHPDINIVDARRFGTITDSTAVDDGHGHGTHVAGIIGAKANEEGVIGVAPGVEITSIKVMKDDGTGADYDIVSGIELALTENCDIVNMSLGGQPDIKFPTALEDAVKNAANLCETNNGITTCNNILFTLAAGNSAIDIADYTPARASTGPDDNIFTIASFGQERKTNLDLWSSFSNYGQPYNYVDVYGTRIEVSDKWVDFVLPGGKIRSTVPGGYASYNGTSMSAPHMAGLLVRYLVKNASIFPCIGAGANGETCVNVKDTDIGTNGKVQRVVKIGNFLWEYEDYYVAADK